MSYSYNSLLPILSTCWQTDYFLVTYYHIKLCIFLLWILRESHFSNGCCQMLADTSKKRRKMHVFLLFPGVFATGRAGEFNTAIWKDLYSQLLAVAHTFSNKILTLLQLGNLDKVLNFQFWFASFGLVQIIFTYITHRTLSTCLKMPSKQFTRCFEH